MRKVNILGRKVSVLAILMAVLVIGTASAAIFMNYATLTGQVTVSNDISVTDSNGYELPIGDTTGFLNFDSLATFTINNEINNDGVEPVIVDLLTTLILDNDEVEDDIVTDYAGLTVDYSVIVGSGVEGARIDDGGVITGAIPVLVPPGGLTIDVTFDATDNVIPGDYTIQVDVNVNGMDYTTFTGDNVWKTINLSFKNSDWELISNGYITVDYVPMGNNFAYRLTSDGVELEDYALIYYADQPNRWVEFGGISGDAGIVINNNVDISDGDEIFGSVNIDMNMPHVDDANYDTTYTDYTQSPDFYDNSCGAKLWLIPASHLTDDTTLPMDTWDGTLEFYMFETELIHYTDTNIV